MADMRFFRTRDGLLQAEKRAFSADEFREAIQEMHRLVGKNAELRSAVGVDSALAYSERLRQSPAMSLDSDSTRGVLGRAVTWSLKRP
ncbi:MULTISPECIES: hypothetical protein [Burkholderia]|uniref:hypothetical protein n=1 Tax=Burkholderia TaxID=32008 RepID=UPI000AA101B7|nr:MULTISPECIES: hypothetical protein [Burkholderia]